MQLCEQQYKQIINNLPLVAQTESLKHEKKVDLEQVKYEIIHGDRSVDMWSGAKWVIF